MSIICYNYNRNTMIMVIRIKRKAYLIMIMGNYVWQEISIFLDRVLE